MSEAELMEFGSSAWSNTIALTALFVTILSGYIVTAFVAGNRLSASQLIIINGTSIILSGLFVSSIYAFSRAALEAEMLAFEMSVQRQMAPIPELICALLILYVVLVFASLKFMWDVRKSKPD